MNVIKFEMELKLKPELSSNTGKIQEICAKSSKLVPAVEVPRPPGPLEDAVPPELPRHRRQAQRLEELVSLWMIWVSYYIDFFCS